AMMENYRKDSPAIINGSNVVLIKDYLTRKASSLFDGEEEDIDLPKSNVLQFFLEDGTKISVRPSGTEPKIKFYFGVKAPLKGAEGIEAAQAECDQKIEAIIKELKLK
ncbi:MAG: phospho-sugar mutase, partial [Bacteroidales bacterium]|nr:phospho-sugar mutase [Bacteroidales bacterium]